MIDRSSAMGILSNLIEGLVFSAASNLHWGMRRWQVPPQVAIAAYQYEMQYIQR